LHFKKLELYGFKSFADKTELIFEPGITAIVGPNGCGKTNIADAIRWALGEQSAKSLRGGKMEDVIFHGTELRKALAMAEVSITLGSAKGTVPHAKPDDVPITRRLYRSGESEYLINGSVCRLKDIEDLFMDTGIGTNAYSILEQGKMDLILQAKPADRRYLFEEAAGISKYKARKEEATRKLESTEQNLLRLSDIIQEIKRQMDSVERQAKKAQRYQEISQALKTAELRLIAYDWQHAISERNRQAERRTSLQTQHVELSRVLSEVDAALASLKQDLLAHEQTLKTHTLSLHECERMIQQTEYQIALYRDRKATLMEVREKATPEMESARLGLAQLQEDLSRQEALAIQLDQVAEAERRRHHELEQQLASLDLLPHETRLAEERTAQVTLLNEISEVKSRLVELEAAKGELMGRLSAVRQEITQLEQQQQELAELEEILSRLSEGVAEHLRPLAQRGRALVHSVRQALVGHWETSTSSLQTLGTELQNSCEALDQTIGERRNALNQLELRCQTLSRVIHELEQHIRHLTEQRTDVIRAMMQSQASLASLQERIHHHHEERDRLAKAISEVREEYARRQADLDLRLKREDELSAEVTKQEATLVELLKRHATLKAQVVQSEEQVQAARTTLAQQEAGLRDSRIALDAVEQERHALDVSITKLDMELQTLQTHLDQTYHLRPDQLEVPSEDLDREALQAEVHERRQKLAHLGPVNLVAMEEYEELRQRYEFLSRQEQDLRQAKASLTQTIRTINQTTQAMFTEAFARIRQNFREVFRHLFQGGDADLLLSDETQVLESGVEILARPPGKRLQNISLLSGGEKALTAIALLFALFKLKPSPFCVLDEIDAPLDDTNIRRFTNMLKEFASDTQFIIMTHSKLTMEVSDTIYGVTMQEPGVSKIVSMRFRPHPAPTTHHQDPSTQPAAV